MMLLLVLISFLMILSLSGVVALTQYEHHVLSIAYYKKHIQQDCCARNALTRALAAYKKEYARGAASVLSVYDYQECTVIIERVSATCCIAKVVFDDAREPYEERSFSLGVEE